MKFFIVSKYALKNLEREKKRANQSLEVINSYDICGTWWDHIKEGLVYYESAKISAQSDVPTVSTHVMLLSIVFYANF